MNLSIHRRALLAASGASMATLALRQARAAPPEQPIRLVVPYAAGGPTDAMARAVAQRMAVDLGQPVVVENRAGAGGDIGADSVARAKPDGLTLLYHSSGMTISPALRKRPAFDPIKDFQPVSLLAEIPAVLLAGPAVPARTAAQLVAHLRAEGGRTAYGSGGNGNGSHLWMVLFLRANGVEATHVPYKGTAPALVDVIGGQVGFMLDALSSALPQIRAQRVRALAVTASRRSAALPDVPTLAEAGLGDLQFETWHGILAPARTPSAVLHRLQTAAVKAVREPELRAQFEPQGVTLVGSTPDAFAHRIATDVPRWAEAVRVAGFDLE